MAWLCRQRFVERVEDHAPCDFRLEFFGQELAARVAPLLCAGEVDVDLGARLIRPDEVCDGLLTGVEAESPEQVWPPENGSVHHSLLNRIQDRRRGQGCAGINGTDGSLHVLN